MGIKKQVESLVKAHNEKIEALILNSDLTNSDKLEHLRHSSNFTISTYRSEIVKFDDLLIDLVNAYKDCNLMLWSTVFVVIEELDECETLYYDAIMRYANESENTFGAAKKRLLGLLFDSIVQRKELGFIINW